MTKRLWAPWRIKFVCVRKKSKCIFCGNKSKKRDAKKYIVARSKHAFSVLNIYPYNNGHVMVAPYRHVKNLEDLRDEELLDLMGLVIRTKKDLDKFLKPNGYNIGLNIGKAGGAGFGHLHVHVVPRWRGDTNFMPALTDTKVIMQSLDELYRILKKR